MVPSLLLTRTTETHLPMGVEALTALRSASRARHRRCHAASVPGPRSRIMTMLFMSPKSTS
eukprot:7592122-Lingulodinium_polyedra.AAC.1